MSIADNRSMSALRARFCFDDVQQWSPRWRGEATTRVKSLPVQIRSQGLLVTLATLMNEGRDHSMPLVDVLARWLLEAAPKRTLRAPTGQTDRTRLLGACSTASRAEYAAAQHEAILLFDQIKLYAVALHGEKREHHG
ncbi:MULTISPECIES: type III-B CRISPR module-associated protein Cmr5 [unclassified Bradyrhizobium]|uniref:type III-B CRISPR module-associated protein Cmr5 n=1 Tax=unclassified Bradyrhizobium TaxID=2631580 RepID=UPI0028E9CC2B|nr:MULTISPECIES: type III-B CRISPR module-associated protein Cmr5 [unclassified Bradyrhizobium]